MKRSYIVLTVLFLAAFLERTVFDLGPNVELVTTAMVLSAFYFSKKDSFWLTLAIMVLTDLIIGNSRIFIFTWSGFLLPALFIKMKKSNNYKNIFTLTTTGLSSNIFFYLWTNFGVWLMSSMYAKTPAGLVMSYMNGLPFLKYQVTSTLLFIPSFYFLIESYFFVTDKLFHSYRPVTKLAGLK